VFSKAKLAKVVEEQRQAEEDEKNGKGGKRSIAKKGASNRNKSCNASCGLPFGRPQQVASKRAGGGARPTSVPKAGEQRQQQ
jgi:hypothetical protein